MDTGRPLLPDAIDIWRVDTAIKRPLSRWWALLSHTEQRRAARYRFAAARRGFIITRGVLRALLSSYLGDAPDKIALSVDANGKPCLTATLPLYFNISHTSGLSLLAFSGTGAVGVDVERADRQANAAAIAARYFSDRERFWLSSLPREQQRRAFLQCWIRKEAYIKALGRGLSPALRRVNVVPPAGSGAVFRVGAWHLQALALAAPYLGALCSRRPCKRNYYEYPLA